MILRPRQYFIFFGINLLGAVYEHRAKKKSKRGDDLPMVTGTTDNRG
jgi:hypothetical protein